MLAQHLAYWGSYSGLGFVGYIKMKEKEKKRKKESDEPDEVGK